MTVLDRGRHGGAGHRDAEPERAAVHGVDPEARGRALQRRERRRVDLALDTPGRRGGADRRRDVHPRGFVRQRAAGDGTARVEPQRGLREHVALSAVLALAVPAVLVLVVLVAVAPGAAIVVLVVVVAAVTPGAAIVVVIAPPLAIVIVAIAPGAAIVVVVAALAVIVAALAVVIAVALGPPIIVVAVALGPPLVVIAVAVSLGPPLVIVTALTLFLALAVLVLAPLALALRFFLAPPVLLVALAAILLVAPALLLALRAQVVLVLLVVVIVAAAALHRLGDAPRQLGGQLLAQLLRRLEVDLELGLLLVLAGERERHASIAAIALHAAVDHDVGAELLAQLLQRLRAQHGDAEAPHRALDALAAEHLRAPVRGIGDDVGDLAVVVVERRDGDLRLRER
ncbi:MAG TPA: hypothetical protein VFS55_18015 [Dokdonella sp.]|nr:hypothetical protein [Dokdonella sp.]